MEIKRASSFCVKVWIGDRKVSDIAEINIQLLPIEKPKVALTRIKKDERGYVKINMVDGVQEIAKEYVEILTSSLVINM